MVHPFLPHALWTLWTVETEYERGTERRGWEVWTPQSYSGAPSSIINLKAIYPLAFRNFFLPLY
jgi:hypothetical protein